MIAAGSISAAPVAAPSLSDAETATLLEAVRAMGLAAPSESVALVPLSGGVSSLIARVYAGGRTFCVKAALSQLRTADAWFAPVERSRREVAWMRKAAAASPGCTPTILGDDSVRNAFAMGWLDPTDHPVWKGELLAGRISVPIAAAVGDVVGRIHAATADRADLATAFATDADFHALRLEPYFEATAGRNPDLANALLALSTLTAQTRRVLVHGDVSPKNILIGPDGPVLLDAECAWFGEPAFDIAFCLNHFALKAAHTPRHADALRAVARALWSAYRPYVVWEAADVLEGRVAGLLPALALARVDGKSPVEYLDIPTRGRVRKAARDLLFRPPDALAEFEARWAEMLL